MELETSSIKDIVLRGIKKMIMEMTSVKFLLMVFVCLGSWLGFLEDTLAMGVAVAIAGLREINLESIFSKITGK